MNGSLESLLRVVLVMNLEDRGIIMENRTAFGTEKISKLLLRLAPPVMLAQLIQDLYNIMDSFL